MIFVWIAGRRGIPEPQKWNDDGGIVGGEPETLARHVLPPDQHGLTLDVLAAIYPCKKDET